MFRSAVSKVMWVGRATAFLVGLSVILALMFGVASAALGAAGESFILGRSNVADNRATTLTSSVADALKATLVLRNTGGTSPLNLRVVDPNTTDPAQKSVAPMNVDSQAKVTNLNSDELDGKDESAFLGKTEKSTDSDKLDGLDSTGFIQGGGKATKGALAVSPGTFPTFFETPEIRLAYSCPPGADVTTSNGILRIRNLSTTETVNLFSDNGGTNPNHYGSLAPNQTFDQSAAASGEFITLGVQGSYVATVEVFSVHRASDNKCHVQAQGLFTK
jgi:hypothetical protein